MAITISPKTEELIQTRMKEHGFASSDEFLQAAMEIFPAPEVCDFDDLDDETKAAIEEADAQIEKGLGRPWDEVRTELLAKYFKPRNS